MATVASPCISTGDGLSITITWDDVTLAAISLSVVNTADHGYTVGWTYGNKGGTRIIASGTNTVLNAPKGTSVNDPMNIWIT